MNKIIKISLCLLFPLVLFTACKKEKPEPDFNTERLAPLLIEFDHINAGRKLVLEHETYKNAAGENYSISMLQYYISNIKVKKADGTEYIVPQEESYFLIREQNLATRTAEVQVPEGDYTQLSFMVGVDSLRNTMDVSDRTGVLDPAGDDEHGMYWSWNSGYIFLKMEGMSDAAPLDPTGQPKYRYHIGGYGGYDSPTLNNTRTITIDLTQAGTANVRDGRKSNIHLMVDVNKILGGPNIKIGRASCR